VINKFVFAHIGRTAGSYVHANLINRFSASQVCPLRAIYPNDVASFDRESIDRYEVYSGHYYTPLLPLLSGNVYAFTVVREPLACFVSAYRHGRDNPGPWQAACRSMSPADAVKHIPHLLANRQTRLVHQFLFDDAHAYEHEHGYTNPGILIRVLERLHHFATIGVTELLPDTFAVLRSQTGLPFNTRILTHRSSSDGGALRQSADVPDVHWHLGLDYTLYAEVLSRLGSQISQLSETAHKHKHNSDMSDSHAREYGSVVFGTGWMQEEINGAGVLARWSGPEPRSVLMVDCPNPFRLTAWVNLFAVEQSTDLRVLIDERQVDFTLTADTTVAGALTRIECTCSFPSAERSRRIVFVTSKFASFGSRHVGSLDYVARNFELVRVAAEPLHDVSTVSS